MIRQRTASNAKSHERHKKSGGGSDERNTRRSHAITFVAVRDMKMVLQTRT